LQDWERATIIGRRTFGKGLVQQQFGLSNGGALRLTISRYYSPLGRNIQKPYSNKSRKEYEEELLERYNDGELVKGDSLKNAGTSFKTPAGRTVYGGGGITPDIFVSADTNFMTKEVNTLFRKNTMSKFVYNYFIENRSYFNEIKTPKDAVNQFVVNENDWSKLVVFAAKDSVQLNNIATVSRTYIMQQFKSLLIKQLFRNQGYFEAMNITDSVVQKAIIELKK
jgi:carboxyl-terminal processing protease